MATPFAVLILIFNNTVETLDLRALNNRLQVVVLVVFAYAAANRTALRKRVVYTETNHSIFASAALRQVAQELAHHLESVAIIEVVRS